MKTELWRFETRALAVVCYAEPEELDPADSFDFDEDIEAVRSGAVDWFCAVVEVQDRESGEVLGSDVLGACAYKSARDFVTGHRDPKPENRNCFATLVKHTICHYFPSMVGQACSEARKTLRRLGAIRVREVRS